MAMSPYVRALRARVGHARILMPSVAGIVSRREQPVPARPAAGRQLLDGARRSIGPEDTPASAVVREGWEETVVAAVT